MLYKTECLLGMEKGDGQSSVLRGVIQRGRGHYNRHQKTKILRLIPTADDHNTSVTCVADYGYSVVNTTVTLTVKCKYAAAFV